MFTLKENKKFKTFRSKFYNYDFNKETGFFARWGETLEDDPNSAPAPEILDIEVTTICKGPGGKVCPFCYKSNNPNGMNMTFETFKKIIDKFPKSLTQVAFGADAQATSNPDLFKMMDYTRSLGYIPNITVADINEDTAKKLINTCGAVAVSRYADKSICYDSIQKLTDLGMPQVNMHLMISEETYEQVLETFKDFHIDSRLSKMNAIVLLSLKQKGRGIHFTPLSQKRFKSIIELALKTNIRFGFDSCSAPKFMNAMEGHELYSKMEVLSESCESTLFSSYVNEKGEFYPCSFTENWSEGNWEKGIEIAKVDNFLKEVWNNPRTLGFRNKLLSSVNNNKCRNCPAYEV